MTRPATAKAALLYEKYGGERRQLLEVRHPRHILGQGVIAVAGIGEDIAGPAGPVRQQVPQGHALSHGFVADAETRQVFPHARIQRQRPLLGQAHDQSRGHGLGDGSDLEDGLVRDRQRILHAGHAAAAAVDRAADMDAVGHAGHIQLNAPGRDLLRDLFELRLIICHVRTPYRAG